MPEKKAGSSLTKSEVRQICIAIIIRLMFGLHNFLAIWRVVMVTENELFWCYCISFAAVLAETFYCVKVRKGVETTWASVSILLYSLINLPPIWQLELDRITPHNETTGDEVSVAGVSLDLDDNTWVYAIEQTFLLVIICGRWILPKGKLSRDKLSQLLFILIGKACDITDFFQLFTETSVQNDSTFVYIILSIWSLSVLQFFLVLTETKERQPNHGNNNEKFSTTIFRICFETEIWCDVVSLSMEELPFLIVRLYVIINYSVLSYSIVFFTTKNSLIIVMYAYRIFAICKDENSTDTSVVAIPSFQDGDQIKETRYTDSPRNVRDTRGYQNEGFSSCESLRIDIDSHSPGPNSSLEGSRNDAITRDTRSHVIDDSQWKVTSNTESRWTDNTPRYLSKKNNWTGSDKMSMF